MRWYASLNSQDSYLKVNNMFGFISKTALKARIKGLEEACRLKEATIKNLKYQNEAFADFNYKMQADNQTMIKAFTFIRDDTKNPMKTRSLARLTLGS